MSTRDCFQGPLDFSEWEPQDLTDDEEAAYQAYRRAVMFDMAADDQDQEEDQPGGDYGGRRFLDVEGFMKLADQQDPPLSEDEQLKADLIRQNHLDNFGDGDPAISDEQAWADYQRAVGGGE